MVTDCLPLACAVTNGGIALLRGQKLRDRFDEVPKVENGSANISIGGKNSSFNLTAS